MRTKSFYGTDLAVSALCLGTVHYGTAMSAQTAHRQMDAFMESGGNFIDTAHVYGDWEPGEKGRSERVIGAWMQSRRARDKLVLATKGGHPLLNEMQRSRVHPEHILEDLTESLCCLRTDVIDLYFLHRDDPTVPVGEIIDCLEEQVRCGRIRWYGCSNWTLARLNEANVYAAKKNCAGFVCNQIMWSLAKINCDGMADQTMIPLDDAFYQYHAQTQCSAMAYMSLAKAYFTRRQQGERLPVSVQSVYSSKENDRIYKGLLSLSLETGLSMTDLSLLFFEKHPFAAVPIASFDTAQQLKDGVRFASLAVDVALIKRLHVLREKA